MKYQGGHLPVLFEETIEGLDLFPGLTVADGTLGGGGHARGILSRIMPGGTFIGIDRDEAAIERVEPIASECHGNVFLVHSDFREIDGILSGLNISGVDRAVLDLGVSSFQLEEADRGFSYQQDAPLDMRMDQSAGATAADIVNTYTQSELTRVLRTYGEEKWSARIADFIVQKRAKAPILTTGQLSEVVRAAVPAAARRDGPHPAKRTFQALRIEVNDELSGLGEALERYVQALRSGGRLAVITFHSLEDRIVKQSFQKLANPCICPPDLPVCACGRKPQVRILTRKPVVAGSAELTRNSRARSAKLRIAQKI